MLNWALLLVFLAWETDKKDAQLVMLMTCWLDVFAGVRSGVRNDVCLFRLNLGFEQEGYWFSQAGKPF